MSCAQCHKPSEQTNPQIQSATYHQKTSTTEIRHNKNHNTNPNEHSFTDKVKEMAHSARKMFHHQEHQGHPVSNHTQKPTSSGSTGTAHCGVKTEKKKKKKKMGKNTEGHEGHCMPRMLDHMKRKKNKGEKHSGSSESGSSSDSDHDVPKKMG